MKLPKMPTEFFMLHQYVEHYGEWFVHDGYFDSAQEAIDNRLETDAPRFCVWHVVMEENGLPNVTDVTEDALNEWNRTAEPDSMIAFDEAELAEMRARWHADAEADRNHIRQERM